jgi:DNA sulfur modification protein DndD
MADIKFSRITLENFVNVGQSTLAFPEADGGENSLHLVLGFNGFGKTTLLHAFSWCLTGEMATFGNDMTTAPSVHTVNWDRESLGKFIPIKVSVHLKVTDSAGIHNVVVIRSKKDELALDSSVLREDADEVEVLVSNALGAFVAHEDPSAFLADHFPSIIKDAFILNGDATLKFLQAGGDARRGRIMNTIKALMDVKLIQEAENHIVSSRSRMVTEANKAQPNATLEQLQETVDLAEKAFSDKRGELEDLQDTNLSTIEARLNVKARLDELLGAWGADALLVRDEFNQLKGSFTGLRSKVTETISNVRQSINSSTALHVLAAETLKKTQDIFLEMREKGEIPNTLPSVLQSVLSSKVCVCGTEVIAGSPEHKHITSELEKLGERSEIAEILQGLSLSLDQSISSVGTWAEDCDAQQIARLDAQNALATAKQRHADLKSQVEAMPNEAIQKTMADLDDLDSKLSKLTSDIAYAENACTTSEKYYGEAKAELDAVMSGDEKYKVLKRQIAMAEKMQLVHHELLNLMKTEVVSAISAETNTIFSEVLGVDQGDSGIELPVTGVEITQDYDLRALSHVENVSLDIERLSGAQMRTLTSALLLAMYKFSNRNIQLVFDTPVAMMDGPLKKRFLSELLARSSSTVLLVTNDELASADHVFPFVTSISTVEHVSVVSPGTQKFPAETKFVEHDSTNVHSVLAEYRARYEKYFIDPQNSTKISLD